MTLEQAFSSGVILSGSVTKNASTDSVNNYIGKWRYISILFDYIQDETSSVEADITDNWVESNYTLQDHIAIKPRVYRLRGCVGEVLYENVSKFLEKIEETKLLHPVFQKTANVLSGVNALSGTVSNYTRAAINVAKQIESSYDRYKKIFNNFRKTDLLQGKRQKALYEILTYMLRERMPIYLTELAFWEECFPQFNNYNKLYFIQSVTAHQGDNAFISDIEVVVKEVRVAQTKTTEVDKSKFGGFVGSKTTETANKGLGKGVQVDATPEEIARHNQLVKETPGTDEWKKYQPVNPISRFFNNINKKMEEYNKQQQSFHYYTKKF